MWEAITVTYLVGFVVAVYVSSRSENLVTKHALLALAWPVTGGWWLWKKLREAWRSLSGVP